ncbi:MAG: DEAD/DEAH box helicase family protein, partial [Okeania sp. SIO2H7]|nr:DEAD/DEAH box helicase family protein [Okeania sp. SIO2H7]
MTNIQLYDYQQQMVGDTYNAIRAGHKRILMIAIMGAGKTTLSSWIMRDCVTRGGRVVFLVSLNVLIDQTLETLQMLGV